MGQIAMIIQTSETIEDIKGELKAPEFIEFGDESFWGMIAKLYVGHRSAKAAVDAAGAIDAIDAIVASAIDRARAAGFRDGDAASYQRAICDMVSM